MRPACHSNPHPFISLLSFTKGKKLIPRALRHTNPEQTLTLLTMVVASFSQLDVVRNAYILDQPPHAEANGAIPAGAPTRREVERETEAFLANVVPPMLATIAGPGMGLRLVSGMLALFVERNNVVELAKTRVGVAFLTIFLSRAEMLKQSGATPGSAGPDESEKMQWQHVFDLLFSRLSSHLISLFPSTRYMATVSFGPTYYLSTLPASHPSNPLRGLDLDAEDRPVWALLASIAVSAGMTQQAELVGEVRELCLRNIMGARENGVGSTGERLEGAKQGADEEAGRKKINNLNLFLHSLGLDSGMIAV